MTNSKNSDEVFKPFENDELHQAYLRIAELEHQIEIRDKALELACIEDDYLLKNFSAKDIPGDINIVDDRTPQYWLSQAKQHMQKENHD